MKSDEIDRLIIKFIEKHYPDFLYQFDSMEIATLRDVPDEILGILSDFGGRLSEAFGPNGMFIDTEYGDALKALGLEETELPGDFKEAFRQPIPDIFRKECDDN